MSLSNPVPELSQGKGKTPHGYKQALEDIPGKQISLTAAIHLATI